MDRKGNLGRTERGGKKVRGGKKREGEKGRGRTERKWSKRRKE